MNLLHAALHFETTRRGKIVISSTMTRFGQLRDHDSGRGDVFGHQGRGAFGIRDRVGAMRQDGGIDFAGINAASANALVPELGINGLGEGGHAKFGRAIRRAADHPRPLAGHR